MKYSSARAQVADEAQDVEQVAGVERVHLALHAEPGEEHDEDRQHQQQPANLAALNEVAEAGKEPSRDRRNGGHRIGLRRGGLGSALPRGCVLRIRHQISTNSFCIRPVTSPLPLRIIMLISLRTPNSGR